MPNTIIGHMTWHCALDNHEPVPREYANGTAEVWKIDDDGRTIVMQSALDKVKDAQKANFLIDDGRTITAWYVAAWHERNVILKPFPTNYDESGARRLRKDDGRPVSFNDWMLGPRKTFHLKVTWQWSAARDSTDEPESVTS